MDNIPRADGTAIDCPPEVKHEHGYTFCAISGKRRFAVKSREWPYAGCRAFAIRHGVEFIYYVLAAHNHLPMPSACVLKINGEECWATEVIKGRDALRQKKQPWPPGIQENLVLTLKNTTDERQNFLRATFLDVMLLGCDRTEYNVLKEEVDDVLRFYYIDHEQSCGWQNDPATGGKIRIHAPEKEIEDVPGRYAKFAHDHSVKEVSTREEREEIFRGIKLTEELLNEVRPMLPGGWVSDEQFAAITVGLAPWWKFLRESPYEKIDETLFG